MKIAAIISALESLAPPALQESYDNAGLITGSPDADCAGILCCLDATEEVIAEAKGRGCNMVVAHHPIIFGGLKKINGRNYVERAVIAAIKNDIALYAIHTNLDAVAEGVSARMAERLGLEKGTILQPRDQVLRKLFTFCPPAQAETVRAALFAAGAGHIGRYSECSFNAAGTGTFRAGEGTQPFVGERGVRHEEPELKIEVIFPAWLQGALVQALKAAHPYEEVAYDIVPLANPWAEAGFGYVGEWPQALSEAAFLERLKTVFGVPLVRHSPLTGKPVRRIAVCGGAGSFLISKALAAGVDAFVTADLKYHEFFEADGRLLLADVGHFESEQFTIDLLQEFLARKFPTFAVLKTGVNTNPVRYS
jgi:dinuclear metal center YbgI/SA1388 family protein